MKTKQVMNGVPEEYMWEQEYERLTQLYTEQYIIKGDVTEELSNALHRADDSLIDMIWDEVVAADPDLTSREEKESQLFELIQQDFLDEFVYLTETQHNLLVRVNAGAPLTEADFNGIDHLFCRKGWVFAFEQKGLRTYVLMTEIRTIISAQLADGDARMLIGLMIGLRKSWKAAIHLYGVFERERLFEIFGLYAASNMGQTDNFKMPDDNLLPQLLNRGLEDMAVRGEGFWLDGDYVISSELESRSEYRNILRKGRGRDYYQPDPAAVEVYCKTMTDQQNPYYQELLQALQQLTGSAQWAENLMFELEYKVVEEDMNSLGLLHLLSHHEFAYNDKEGAAELFCIFNNWIFEVRRWSNRGYSNKELGFLKTEWIPDLSAIVKGAIHSRPNVKIGRNDPCPCGSGKKYKKCCMGKAISWKH